MTLTREYELGYNKNIHGMATAVRDFFQGYSGVDVNLIKIDSGNYVVICETKKVDVMGVVNFDPKKIVGFDINAKVSFQKKGGKAVVDYTEKSNNAVRAAAAVGLSFVGLGIPKLLGAKKRHDIPDKVHQVIKAYLA